MEEILNDRQDLTYCLTIFVTLYNIIKNNKDKYDYGIRFCVNQGIDIIKERYPDTWKDMEGLI